MKKNMILAIAFTGLLAAGVGTTGFGWQQSEQTRAELQKKVEHCEAMLHKTTEATVTDVGMAQGGFVLKANIAREVFLEVGNDVSAETGFTKVGTRLSITYTDNGGCTSTPCEVSSLEILAPPPKPKRAPAQKKSWLDRAKSTVKGIF